MAYAIPASSAVDFALAGAYSIPAAGAVDFALPPGAAPTVVYSAVPGVTISIAGRWQRANHQDRATVLTQGAALASDRAVSMAYGIASPRGPQSAIPWGDAPAKDIDARAMAWGRAAPSEKASIVPWGTPPRKDLVPLALVWARAQALTSQNAAMPFLDATARDRAWQQAWRSTVRQRAGGATQAQAYLIPASSAVDFALAGEYLIPAGTIVNMALQRGMISAAALLRIPVESAWLLPSGRAPSINLNRELPWGWGHSKYRKDPRWRLTYPDTDDPNLKLPTEGGNPTILDSYLMINLITATRLSDGLPLAIQDMSISLDVDSWAWQLRASIFDGATMAAIAPSSTGLVDIQVDINGHRWIFMVESYQGSGKHGEQRYTITGVSRTQYMAAPYAARASYANAAQINAVQAASEALQYTGFLLDWNYLPGDTTPDWTYPVGSLSYQDKTPIEVVRGIAASAGAVLIPHRDTDGWVLQPRLRASPWALSGAYMNAIVHYSIVTSLGEQYQPAPLYNAAFVSGTRYGQGVSVTRYGTAGNQPAPDMFTDDMVALDQVKERGRQIIANSGNRSLVTLSCHLPPANIAPGLVEPGDHLEFQGETETWRGYVLGVSINAPGRGAINVTQTIKAIRYHEH